MSPTCHGTPLAQALPTQATNNITTTAARRLNLQPMSCIESPPQTSPKSRDISVRGIARAAQVGSRRRETIFLIRIDPGVSSLKWQIFLSHASTNGLFKFALKWRANPTQHKTTWHSPNGRPFSLSGKHL